MDQNNRFYTIQQANREADIYIFGDITPFRMFEGDVSGLSIVQEIKNLDVDQINVHINSYGGAVSEGWAIYNTLLNHPAKIVTIADGFVASAALYPYMAGDVRKSPDTAMFFFHEVMTGAEGYAKDLRAAADMAEHMTDVGITAFVDRAGMTAEETRALMEAETWLDPWQALEKGIVTVVEKDAGSLFSQDAKRAVMKRLMQQASLASPPDPPSPPEPTANPILKLFETI